MNLVKFDFFSYMIDMIGDGAGQSRRLVHSYLEEIQTVAVKKNRLLVLLVCKSIIAYPWAIIGAEKLIDIPLILNVRTFLL